MAVKKAAVATRKVTNCKAEIKTEALVIEVCGKALVSDGLGGLRCPIIKEHLMKYKTGFCQNGDCEGSSKRSKNGSARRTCDLWKVCPCDCHKMYDMMFAQSEMPRNLVDNSGWSPDHGRYLMPTPEERMAAIASSMPNRHHTPVLVESAAPTLVPATIRRTFAPTATGRAARGELAAWVKDECDIWLIDESGNPCTPVYLAESIAKTQGFGKPPSVGAIDAVLKRWVNIGFAVIEKKPTRFVKYTEQGVSLGLEGCLAKARQAKNSSKAEQARSFHR